MFLNHRCGRWRLKTLADEWNKKGGGEMGRRGGGSQKTTVQNSNKEMKGEGEKSTTTTTTTTNNLQVNFAVYLFLTTTSHSSEEFFFFQLTDHWWSPLRSNWELLTVMQFIASIILVPYIHMSTFEQTIWSKQYVTDLSRPTVGVVTNWTGYDTNRVMVDVSRACIEKGIPRFAESFCGTEPHILIVFRL